MVKIEKDRFWVSVFYTANLGNYENVKIEAGFSQSFEEGEAPLEYIEEAIDEVLKVVAAKAEGYKEDS